MAIITNPETGVEFDDLTGNSTKKFVAVELNGVVRDTNGEKWPSSDGFVHKQPYEYFEIVPFDGEEYDNEKFYVKSERVLDRYTPKPPAGHPQGIYKTVQTLHLLPKSQLKSNALERFNQAQSRVWPQDPSYDKVLIAAQKALDSSGSGNPEIGTLELYEEIIETDNKIEAAVVHNRLRLAELYKEIDALEVDENGDLELDANGQVKTSPNGIQFDRMLTLEESGWVNGVA